MSFGWNVAPAQITDRDELFSWFQQSPNAPALVINDVPYAQRLRLAGAGPVFCRTTSGSGDAGGNLARTPEEMFKRYQDVFNANLIAEYFNEVGVAKDTAPKMVKAAEYALSRGGQVAIPGLQVGVPNDWSLMLPLVELALKYPVTCWITFHQYFGLAATSGMGGLAPEEFLGAWSPDAPLPTGPYYHCGRYRGLFKVLDDPKINLPHPPLMAITEANSALLGDIDTWQKSQLWTGPCPPGYGWRSSGNAWAKAYPGKPDEQVFSEKMIWLNDNLWRPDGINNVIVYCWEDNRDLAPCGDISWIKFSCRGSSIPARLSTYNASINGNKGKPPMWFWTTIQPKSGVANLRSAPRVSGTLTRQLTTAQVVQVDGGNFIPDATVPGYPAGEWIPVRVSETAATEYVFSEVIANPPPAVVSGHVFSDTEVQEMQANLDYVQQILGGRTNQ